MDSSESIALLFKANYEKLFRIAFRITQNKDDADDVVQDVFYTYWEKKDSIDINSSLEGYLVRSTMNKAINLYKKNKKTDNNDVNDIIELKVIAKNEENNYDNEMLKNTIQKALANLPEKCLEIFMLVRFEGMKQKEVAEKLNISPKTVENQIMIAMQKLKKDLLPKLEKHFPDFF